MTGVEDIRAVRFQCPKCGQELEQTLGKLRSGEHMRCQGCGIGINIDTNRLANAADEIQRAIEMAPPEITIKFFR
jgi:transcription elongation factor Elf1